MNIVLVNFVPESRLRALSWTSQWHPLHLPPGCLITLSNCRIQFVSCPQTAGSGSGIGLRTRDPPGSETGITKSYSLPSQQYYFRYIDHDTNIIILAITQFNNRFIDWQNSNSNNVHWMQHSPFLLCPRAPSLLWTRESRFKIMHWHSYRFKHRIYIKSDDIMQGHIDN
jgi:hypothetical protein